MIKGEPDMKISKKIIAVILVLVTVFSISAPATTAMSPVYSTILAPAEKSVLTTARFLQLLKPITTVLRMLSGKGLSESNVEINFCEGVAADLCAYILENSGFDIPTLCKQIPLDTSTLEMFYSVTGTDTAKVREEIHKLRKQADAEGDTTKSYVLYFLENYLSVIKKVDIYTVPFGEDGVTRAMLDITRMDGTVETVYTDIFFSPEGLVYGRYNKGLLGLGFECSVYDLLIYATTDCWMKDFGFCFFYDFFCYTTPFFNYLTRRFKFDYDGKEWMIQIWKGNYVIANGCEVGIYNREPGSFGTYYDCYDGTMKMSAKLSYCDNTIYEIEQEHWWLNGFKLGDTLYKPSLLKMEFSVELIDEEMANAFANAINNHYMHDVSCTVDGNRVSAIW